MKGDISLGKRKLQLTEELIHMKLFIPDNPGGMWYFNGINPLYLQTWIRLIYRVGRRH